jgi:hypothetical protein
VGGGVDFGCAWGLEGLLGVLGWLVLGGVLVVGVGLVGLLVVLLVLRGGDCGGERGDVGLQVGKLAWLRGGRLVDGVCFAGEVLVWRLLVCERGLFGRILP